MASSGSPSSSSCGGPEHEAEVENGPGGGGSPGPLHGSRGGAGVRSGPPGLGLSLFLDGIRLPGAHGEWRRVLVHGQDALRKGSPPGVSPVGGSSSAPGSHPKTPLRRAAPFHGQAPTGSARGAFRERKIDIGPELGPRRRATLGRFAKGRAVSSYRRRERLVFGRYRSRGGRRRPGPGSSPLVPTASPDRTPEAPGRHLDGKGTGAPGCRGVLQLRGTGGERGEPGRGPVVGQSLAHQTVGDVGGTGSPGAGLRPFHQG